MLIRHKGVEHCIYAEAPFIGARISSISCSKGCPGCHNDYLKASEHTVEDTQDIIDKVKENPFNEGIILGGLEWSEQPEEMLELIRGALEGGLQVMVYTHQTEQQWFRRFPRLPIWIKFGEYVQGSEPHKMFGVKLSSSNQTIKKYFK